MCTMYRINNEKRVLFIILIELWLSCGLLSSIDDPGGDRIAKSKQMRIIASFTHHENEALLLIYCDKYYENNFKTFILSIDTQFS